MTIYPRYRDFYLTRVEFRKSQFYGNYATFGSVNQQASKISGLNGHHNITVLTLCMAKYPRCKDYDSKGVKFRNRQYWMFHNFQDIIDFLNLTLFFTQILDLGYFVTLKGS